MSIFRGLRQGGVRGGKDQFQWDTVKTDKDRTYYLGNSLKAPVGRWQNGKDLTWYTKQSSDLSRSMEDERRAVQEEEKQRMMEALGLVPKRRAATDALSAADMQSALARGQSGLEANDEIGAAARDAARVSGLGFGPVAHSVTDDQARLERIAMSALHEAPTQLPGSGVDQPASVASVQSQSSSRLRGISFAASAAASAAVNPTSDGKGAESEADRRKAEKAAKRERKAQKKALKAARKAEKAARRGESGSRSRRSRSRSRSPHARRRHDSSSSSGSESDSPERSSRK